MKTVLERQAQRRLTRFQPKLASLLLEAIEAIAADPFGTHPQAKPLKDRLGVFRLRHGGWRILYRIERSADELRVMEIETRD